MTAASWFILALVAYVIFANVIVHIFTPWRPK